MTIKTEKTELPLVTFVIISFNHENFITDAILGAFSQTYPNLEILISDDCSTDNTPNIIEELVKQYSGGHKILYNRNQKNLGIGYHINKIMELSHGNLIVIAAGDDISLPGRVKATVDLWCKDPDKILSISTQARFIDENGELTNNFTKFPNYQLTRENGYKRRWHCVGCSHAWSRKTFDFFGKIHLNITNEDLVIGIRSFLLGNIAYIPEVFVHYRIHQKNISSVYSSKNKTDSKISFIDKDKYAVLTEINTLNQIIIDINHYIDFFPNDIVSKKLIKKIRHKKNIALSKFLLYNDGINFFNIYRNIFYIHLYKYLIKKMIFKITVIL